MEDEPVTVPNTPSPSELETPYQPEGPKVIDYRRLSTVSRRYDREGKGYLDETELALRRMDSKNQGFLDLDKIHGIVSELHNQERRNSALIADLTNEHKANLSLRRGIFLLCAFTILLTVANIGTSLAAARLAKDTQVSANNDLQSLSTGIRLGTTPKDVVINMEPVSEEARSRRHRHLAAAEAIHCSNATAATAANQSIACELGGLIGAQEAKKLYELFCPGYPEAHSCGSGVPKVNLNCHGHLSTLFGGTQLPPYPPVSSYGMTTYPTEGFGYIGEAATFLFSRLMPCVQQFSVGLSCPDDAYVSEDGEVDDACMMFLSWEPGYCLGRVKLCGRDSTGTS